MVFFNKYRYVESGLNGLSFNGFPYISNPKPQGPNPKPLPHNRSRPSVEGLRGKESNGYRAQGFRL